jgi:putative glutamine transport system permease protein
MRAFADIFTGDNTKFLFAGFVVTIIVSVVTVLLSILFGKALALLRNYGGRVFRKLASAYIEIFRGTPLLLWILVCVFMLPFSTALGRGTLALTLYTSSVIAEIVRGGLNAIAKGQFEAARSQGFNFAQTFAYIVLPQCFRRIVPSLMSQIITTVKDTSFFAQFGIAEFFFNAKTLMGILPQKVTITTGHIFIIFGFIALMYFAVNFSLSVVVRKCAKGDEEYRFYSE